MAEIRIPRKKELEKSIREAYSKKLKESDFDGDTLCVLRADYKGKFHIVK